MPGKFSKKKLNDKKCLLIIIFLLFVCRVRFHKAVGINNLGEWPSLNVNNSFKFGAEYGLLTIVIRSGLNA